MRVTLLGHASVLVEMEGACCLMDTVFGDPFEEGIVISCPRREVFPARLPAVDTLIVSHRHPDHFDIPSLAQVNRDCDAICPADPAACQAADVVHRIAASALVGWIERKKSFFCVRAYSRRFNTLCQLSHDSERVELKPRPLPDLLMHYVLNCSEGSELFAKQQVELQLAALKA